MTRHSEFPPAGTTIYLKQFGELRTGTNVLRALLSRSFADALVLMHVLGDKHSPPADLDRICRETAHAADPAWQLVSYATWARPAVSTDPGSESQRAYLARIADDLAATVRQHRLQYLVSVKDPYWWALSLADWQNWLPRRFRAVPRFVKGIILRGEIVRRTRDACFRFNRNYTAWLELHDRCPERTSIVRIEDLLDDTPRLLARLALHHGLVANGNDLKRIRGAMHPAVWDDGPQLEEGDFEPRRTAIAQRLSVVTAAIHSTVTDSIDWNLARRLGYGPRG